MINADTLEMIRPKGLRMLVDEIDPKPSPTELGGIPVVGCDRKFYQATVSGKLLNGEFKETIIEFSLPVDEDGVYTVGGLRRVVVPQGILDLEDYQLGKEPSYLFRSRGRVLMIALRDIFDRCFTEFFMTGEPPPPATLQNEIDFFFKASSRTQTAPESRIGLTSIKEMVYVDAPEEGLDLSNRKFPRHLLGYLDPASTPSSERVNKAFRRSKGATVVGEPEQGESLFCSTITDHHLPVSLNPRRTHLARSAYESSIELDYPDKPLIGNPGLSGKHLLTAVMNHRCNTGDDAIVVSLSAAVKLRATRKVTEQMYVTGSLHMKVKEGEGILPGDLLAEAVDPLTDVKVEFRTRNLRGPAIVRSISAVQSTYFNEPATRIRVVCESTADAQCGDKVFTRAAIKGVLRVVPNEDMPVTDDGRIIEAIVGPESIVGRRAMAAYWEMMGNAYAKDGGTVLVDHFDPRPSFGQLVEHGYGEPVQLTYLGEVLPEKTYIGEMFFIRLDKIAREILSIHAGEVPLNGMGLPIDAASRSGQKRDFAKAAAMKARGLDQTLLDLQHKNTYAKYALEELRKVLSPQV